jgi:hypothetical protein
LLDRQLAMAPVQQEHRVRRQQRQVAAKGHGIEREGNQG